MVFFQYFLLLLCSVEMARGAAGSRHRRMVAGNQEGSLVDGKVQNSGNLGFIVYITTEQFYVARDKTTNEWEYFSSPAQCGGAIIREDIVLTAAHCLKKAKISTIKVHAGIVHKDHPQDSKQVGTAKHVMWHEDYQDGWEYDLGVIYLHNKLTVSEHVKLINLPKAEDYNNVETTMVAGWGRDETGSSTDWLKSAEFKIADNIVCQVHTQHVLTEKEICVIGKSPNMTVCKGDSGGPLFHRNVVLGVASNMIGDQNPDGSCNPDYPAVFVKVLNYIDWINDRLESEGMNMDVFRKVLLMRKFFKKYEQTR